MKRPKHPCPLRSTGSRRPFGQILARCAWLQGASGRVVGSIIYRLCRKHQAGAELRSPCLRLQICARSVPAPTLSSRFLHRHINRSSHPHHPFAAALVAKRAAARPLTVLSVESFNLFAACCCAFAFVFRLSGVVCFSAARQGGALSFVLSVVVVSFCCAPPSSQPCAAPSTQRTATALPTLRARILRRAWGALLPSLSRSALGTAVVATLRFLSATAPVSVGRGFPHLQGASVRLPFPLQLAVTLPCSSSALCSLTSFYRLPPCVFASLENSRITNIKMLNFRNNRPPNRGLTPPFWCLSAPIFVNSVYRSAPTHHPTRSLSTPNLVRIL